jgi:membrane-associated phospholipid phosphatase
MQGKHNLHFKPILILLIILSLPYTIAAQQDPDEGRFGDYLEADLKGLNDLLTVKNGFITAYTTGALYLISLKDEEVRQAVQSGYRGWKKTYLDITNELGNPLYVLPAAGGIFGLSLLSDNSKFQDASFTSMESVVVSMLFVGGIKVLVGRARPYAYRGPHYFSPFSLKKQFHSFPSGHTSTAFAFTVPWIVYYPNVLTLSMLVLPTGTALARIAKDKHWLTDVIAGALVGGLTGYSLAKWNREIKDDLLEPASQDIALPLLYLRLSF